MKGVHGRGPKVNAEIRSLKVTDIILNMKHRLLALLILLIPLATSRTAGTQSGTTACPSSGAAQVKSSGAIYGYTVQAPTTNMGTINLGGSSVTTTTGVQLQPSWSYSRTNTAAIYNLGSVFFACSNSSDSVTWTYDQ